MISELSKKVCERGQHCSCFFDSFLKWDWGECCGLHDKRYANKRLNREQADELLRRCVLRKTGCKILANGMYYAVRVFGQKWYDKANGDSE